MNKTEINDEKLGLYEKLIAPFDGIEKKGKTMPYTSMNGHMFSFLDAEGRLGLRLPKNEREEFIKKYNTRLCEAHGTVLKEYVLVPDELFASTKELSPWFDASIAYIKTLKPKATKRKS